MDTFSNDKKFLALLLPQEFERKKEKKNTKNYTNKKVLHHA